MERPVRNPAVDHTERAEYTVAVGKSAICCRDRAPVGAVDEDHATTQRERAAHGMGLNLPEDERPVRSAESEGVRQRHVDFHLTCRIGDAV